MAHHWLSEAGYEAWLATWVKAKKGDPQAAASILAFKNADPSMFRLAAAYVEIEEAELDAAMLTITKAAKHPASGPGYDASGTYVRDWLSHDLAAAVKGARRVRMATKASRGMSELTRLATSGNPAIREAALRKMRTWG